MLKGRIGGVTTPRIDKIADLDLIYTVSNGIGTRYIQPIGAFSGGRAKLMWGNEDSEQVLKVLTLIPYMNSISRNSLK
jgi:hypothetical protein